MSPRRTDETVLDGAVVEASAAEFGVDPADLAGLAVRHQTSVADLPGAENLAYEWRKHYEDPLIDRTERAYYLAVPDGVWAEFGDRLGADEAALEALIDVHRRTVADRTDADPDPPPDRAYVVLDRRVAERAE